MIVFFGDSITRDWPIEEVWEGALLNRGVAGETTGQMRRRFEQDVIALRPQVVHLLGGINDIAENQGPVAVEEIAANLDIMVEAARCHGIGVVLGLLLPCTIVAKRPQLKPRRAVRRLNALLQSRRGVVLADYFSPLSDPEDRLRPTCTDDGLHPNAAGYAVMTPVARLAITAAQASSTR